MTEQDFITEILANPDDDMPRLIFADWLEERGDPRSEFIRVQCELARLTPAKPWMGMPLYEPVLKYGGRRTKYVDARLSIYIPSSNSSLQLTKIFGSPRSAQISMVSFLSVACRRDWRPGGGLPSACREMVSLHSLAAVVLVGLVRRDFRRLLQSPWYRILIRWT